MKNSFFRSTLDINSTIENAIQNLNKSDLQICLICKDKRLIGTITDGDIRRGLINGLNLKSGVDSILNKNFIFIKKNEKYSKAVYLMKLHKIYQIPVFDENFFLKDLFVLNKKDNTSVKKKSSYYYGRWFWQKTSS